MASRANVQTGRPLPSTTPVYDPLQAEVMRRTIETNVQDLYAEIARLRDQYDSESFLAACATNFLFMGAPGKK